MEDVADVSTDLVEFNEVEFTHVLVIHKNFTGVRPNQADHVFEDHGFTRPREPDDAQRLPIQDLEIQAPKDLVSAERTMNVLKYDAHNRTTAQNASRTRISILDTTTARVVATPTPPAPPFAWNP